MVCKVAGCSKVAYVGSWCPRHRVDAARRIESAEPVERESEAKPRPRRRRKKAEGQR